MASRLTNADRDRITARAIEASFSVRTKAMTAREDELVSRCYDFVHDKSVQKKVAALPEGWVGSDSCLRFNVNGAHIVLKSTQPYRVPSRSYCGMQGAVTGPLADEVLSFAADKEAYSAERTQARRSLRALLGSVSSLAALEARWPEGKPFFKRPDGISSDAVPAVRFDDVNAMLGLVEATQP